MQPADRIERLITAISGLSDYRMKIVENVVGVFELPKAFERNTASDLITSGVVDDFGDVLRIHHCFSREPFSKDKFEFALERVMQAAGKTAALAARGQRGFDIAINDQRFSLKTEAAKAIRTDSIHISKFMELGGGVWGENPGDLIGLRKRFLELLAGIERILILRAIRKGTPDYFYELVEIPKSLLAKAEGGRLEMMSKSVQMPKPGYCYVEENGETQFSLYFDGGGERKLQVKGLLKSHCILHASWQFEPLDTQF